MSNIQETSVKEGDVLFSQNICCCNEIKILKSAQEHFPYVQKIHISNKSENPDLGQIVLCRSTHQTTRPSLRCIVPGHLNLKKLIHNITSAWVVDREFFDISFPLASFGCLWSAFGAPWADFGLLLTPLGALGLPLGVLWAPLVPFGAPLASLLPPSGLPLAVLVHMEPG